MNDYELRKRLARELGRRGLPDIIWQSLPLDLLDPWTDEPEAWDEEWDDIRDRARNLVSVWEDGGRSALSSRRAPERRDRAAGSTRLGTGDAPRVPDPAADDGIFVRHPVTTEVQQYLTHYERRRAEAASAAFEREAERQPSVQRFREKVLQGRTLTRAEADAFVHSAALRFLHVDHVASGEIALTEHTARVLEWEAGWVPTPTDEALRDRSIVFHCAVDEHRSWLYRYRAVVRVDPPGKDFAAEILMPDERIFTVGRYASRHVGAAWLGADPPFGLMFQNSAVWELDQTCAQIAPLPIPWDERQAGLWLLTGERPFVSPLRADLGFHAVGTTPGGKAIALGRPCGDAALTAELWLDGRSVAAAYRHIQRWRCGKDNRRLGDRNVAVFKFVTEKRPKDPESPDWRALMDAWNALQEDKPEWKYRYPSIFARDFERAEDILMRPPDCGRAPSGAPGMRPDRKAPDPESADTPPA